MALQLALLMSTDLQPAHSTEACQLSLNVQEAAGTLKPADHLASPLFAQELECQPRVLTDAKL